MKEEIHISDLKTFVECRRKWNWASMMREGLERIAPYAPFFTGRAVHWCLQQYYENGTAPNDSLPRYIEREVKAMEEIGSLWDSEKELLNEQVTLLSGILEHYSIWAPRQDDLFSDKNLRFLSLETEFSVPLRNPISGRASTKVYLAGRFDGVVERLDNHSYWLWETKTARSIDVLTSSLFNDMQAGAYLIAAQEMFGVKFSGILYNVIRKKVPTTPRLLNDGTLSKAQNIDTTPEYYMQAIKATHAEWFDEDGNCNEPELLMSVYGDFLKYLMVEAKPFFARQPVRRTQQELSELAEEIHYYGLEMARPTTRITANGAALFNVCSRCQFKAPCLAMNQGADYQSILAAEYRPRRKWDALEAEEVYDGATNHS